MSITDLQSIDPSEEHLFAVIAHQLMHGVPTEKGFLKLIKNNDVASEGDDALYLVDYRIELGKGNVVGYIDLEKKVSWRAGSEWTYPRINVARFPLTHWKRDQYSGREANKIIAFREKPECSFWVGARSDYRSVMVVPARHVIGSPVQLQPTGYSENHLPVFAISNHQGREITSPDEFTGYITEEVLKNVES